jgi:hypothetical protein
MASLGSDTKIPRQHPPCQRHPGLRWDGRTSGIGSAWRGVRGEIVRLRAPKIEVSHMLAFRGEYWCTNPQSSDIERYAWVGGR